MGGLKPSREVVLRSTVDGLPLILFRPGAPESCAMTVELGPATRVGGRVLLSGEAVEELYALAELILEGRPPGVVDAQIMCGAIYSDGVECALPDGHAPIGRGVLANDEADTHVTPGGMVFDADPLQV